MRKSLQETSLVKDGFQFPVAPLACLKLTIEELFRQSKKKGNDNSPAACLKEFMHCRQTGPP